MATTNRSVTNNPGNRGSEPGGPGTGGEGNAPTQGSPARAENEAGKQRSDQNVDNQAETTAEPSSGRNLSDRR
jgi:hypothetical protein